MGVDGGESEYQRRDENLSQTNVPDPGKCPHNPFIGHVREKRNCDGKSGKLIAKCRGTGGERCQSGSIKAVNDNRQRGVRWPS